MATNKKTKAITKKDANTLNITSEEGKGNERKFAEVTLSPTIINTITAQTFIKPIVGVPDRPNGATRPILPSGNIPIESGQSIPLGQLDLSLNL